MYSLLLPSLGLLLKRSWKETYANLLLLLLLLLVRLLSSLLLLPQKVSKLKFRIEVQGLRLWFVFQGAARRSSDVLPVVSVYAEMRGAKVSV